jgi:starch synthase
MLKPLDFVPDVVHIHDWHPALIPNLIERVYADDEQISGLATALTIHNLSIQGSFGFGTLQLAGLEPWGLIRPGIPHLDDVVNVLGRGIHFTDVFNTVSERYAEEIQTPEYGEGLDELIRAHAHKLFGIVNGIDVELFDPERDPAVPHHYSAAQPESKALNKAALRAQLGLSDNSHPLVALISRFYDVKGLDLLQQALPGLLGLDVQFAVLGTGDRRYEDLFRYQAAQSPGRFSATIGFDPQLAQRVYAGADMLLMPSRSEPGGLGQLIGLRYGTIPIVRATGGLADTITDFDPASDSGVGFRFETYDSWQLFAAVVRALETYRHPSVWRRLVQRAMAEDVSWSRSARRYVQLYLTAIAGRREGRGVAAAGAVQAG